MSFYSDGDNDDNDDDNDFYVDDDADDDDNDDDNDDDVDGDDYDKSYKDDHDENADVQAGQGPDHRHLAGDGDAERWHRLHRPEPDLRVALQRHGRHAHPQLLLLLHRPHHLPGLRGLPRYTEVQAEARLHRGGPRGEGGGGEAVVLQQSMVS